MLLSIKLINFKVSWEKNIFFCKVKTYESYVTIKKKNRLKKLNSQFSRNNINV